jgi:hypothetical protein
MEDAKEATTEANEPKETKDVRLRKIILSKPWSTKTEAWDSILAARCKFEPLSFRLTVPVTSQDQQDSRFHPPISPQTQMSSVTKLRIDCEMPSIICSLTKCFPSLTYLSICMHNGDAGATTALFYGLKLAFMNSPPQLSTFIFYGGQFSEGCLPLADLIHQQSQSLTELDLTQFHGGKDGSSAWVTNAIQKCSKLQRFKFYTPFMNDKSQLDKSLSMLFQTVSSLETLDLQSRVLSSALYSLALNEYSSLTKLSLVSGPFDEAMVEAIGALITAKPSFRTLEIGSGYWKLGFRWHFLFVDIFFRFMPGQWGLTLNLLFRTPSQHSSRQ